VEGTVSEVHVVMREKKLEPNQYITVVSALGDSLSNPHVRFRGRGR
jgi:hypothetical protein